MSKLKRGGGVVRTSFGVHDNVPIASRDVGDQIWDENVAKSFAKVLHVLS